MPGDGSIGLTRLNSAWLEAPHPPPTTRVTTLAVYSTIGTMRA